MNNMQSKVENPESFNWFLKTLQEEEKKLAVSGEQPVGDLDPSLILNLLRFVKVLSPTVDKLMEFSRTELNLSMLTTTVVLDELEKQGDIVILEVLPPLESVGTAQVTDRIVRITDLGLSKL